MPKKIDEKEEVKEEVKEKGFKVYAEFEFRGRQYKVGESFVPSAGLLPDPALDEFRRVSTRKNEAKGRTFYYEILGKEEPEIIRVVLPVE